MPKRTPGWALPLVVAVAAVIGLMAPFRAAAGIALSGLTASDAEARVDPGLVLINTDIGYQHAAGAGTGIVLSQDGEVLTNNHVVEGATHITATDVGTGQSYPAYVVGYDRKHDVAVLQLRGASGLPTAPLGDSSQVAVGDSVLAVGNASGQGLQRSPGAVTALGQTIVAADELASAEQLNGLIQVSANLIPGDSGGPLVNDNGQVIGVDTAGSGTYRLSGGSGADGFVIPIDTALSIAQQIRSGTRAGSVHIGDTALLGVGVSASAHQGAGVPVSQVLRGSPADQAGIAPGDVITGMNGTAIHTDTALTDLLDQQYPGNDVSVTWLDQTGEQHNATVSLTTGPAG
jgi:S1-C subfamily serine protease